MRTQEVRTDPGQGVGTLGWVAAAGLALLCMLESGCVAPIGAERVSTREAYAQVESSALRTGNPGANTVEILHRYDLDRLAARQPDEAVRQLHARAVDTGERGLLFALAELSFVAGEHIRRSITPWDPRDARDYYLGSAVYGWLFLFGGGKGAPAGAFDRRFREACDLYNYGLGLALTGRRSTNAVVHLQSGKRRLPVGEIELRLAEGGVSLQLDGFEQVLLADQFRVRGLSVRNREPGLGAPLICVGALNRELGLRPATPATAFLRGPATLADLSTGDCVLPLELHSTYDGASVAVGDQQVPLENDLTTFRAYTLNQSTVWKLGLLDFLAPAERIRSQLILNQPFEPGRIPLVFVHGTFSSPVTWAELANALVADPVLRKRYQLWSFIYGSGNPLIRSVADLRAALTVEIQRWDPEGTNAVLRQMVVIGHSQGGLLAKGTALDSGDRIWRLFSTNSVEDLEISEDQKSEIRARLFLKPLPFVRRVVFIATPHRGSYLSGSLVRRLARRLVSLPAALVSRGEDLMKLAAGSEADRFLQGRLPTSLDGMSPKNPGLLALADVPVSAPIKAHSIVAINGDDQAPEGGDGLVKYVSAHVDYAESEFIVRSPHSCLNQPATIEEVRRILHEHLEPRPPMPAQTATPGSLKSAAGPESK